MDLEEEETYINIDNLVEIKKKLFQIQIENENILIKTIGYVNEIPDLIILENFGLNNNLSIYNCILSEEELLNYKNYDLFFPLIKLVEKKNDTIENIYSIGVKFYSDLNFDIMISKYNLFFLTKNINNFVTFKEIPKKINKNNIIEKLIDFYLEINK